MNGIYRDENYPRLITKDWLLKMDQSDRLRLKTIATKWDFEGSGIAVMPVDILPSELPKESSIHFSEALRPYLRSIAKSDFSESFEKLSLPGPIKKEVIVHKGELTPKYSYLKPYVSVSYKEK